MPKTLLLADDSITIQKVVGITFANEDFRVTSVDNGEDALAKARELRPDIVLADVVMPRRNGYQLCEAIKSDPALRATPVLLLTGSFEAFDESRARAAHADGHIAKPFDSQSLINKVRELTGGKPAAAPGAPLIARPAAPAPMARPAAPAAARPPGPGMPPAGAPRPGVPMAPAGARPPGPGMPLGAPRPGAPIPPPGARPLGPGMPPAGAPRPGAPTPPGAAARPGMPGVMPPGARLGMPPAGAPRPGAPIPPGAAARPGMYAPMPPGARPGMPPAGAPRPGAPTPPGAAARPYAPAPAAPTRPAAPAARRDPFGFGVGAPPAARPPPAPEEDFGDIDVDASTGAAPAAPSRPAAPPPAPELSFEMDEEPPEAGPAPIELPAETEPEPELAPMHAFVPPASAVGHKPEPLAPRDGGEALLREALSKASLEVIEKVVWEVVPQLAETIIRENLDRLVKQRP